MPFSKTKSNTLVLLPALVFLLLFVALYPWYQYIIDDDGVGYATITYRWSSGDYYRAVNGLWSPLHCWVALPFYKWFGNLYTAYKASNALIGVGILCTTHKLIRRFSFPGPLHLALLFAIIPFLLVTTFIQLAADNLFCLLFLLNVLLWLQNDCFSNLRNILVLSICGAFAYLAKAYAFPLFFLQFTVFQFYLFTQSNDPAKKHLLVRNLLVGYAAFLLLCAPWLVALHAKYGIWTINMNANYGLFPWSKQSVPNFVAPPWPNSPTIWEDPYYGRLPQWQLSSVRLLAMQLPKELAHNSIELIKSLLRISAFSVAIIAALVLHLIKNKDLKLTVLLGSILVLPSGYLLLHIEDRFLWPLTLLVMISGACLLTSYFKKHPYERKIELMCWLFFFGSFLVEPMNNLQDLKGNGKDAHDLATILQQNNLVGRFASNGNFGLMRQTAFLTSSQYIEGKGPGLFSRQLPQVLKDERIRYFYLFYQNQEQLALYYKTPLVQTAKDCRHIPAHRLLVVRNL